MHAKNLLINPTLFFEKINWRDHKNEIILLAILAGVVHRFADAQMQQYGDSRELAGIIGFCLISGILLGWLWIYISAIIVRWSGEFFGGKATNKEIFAVAAYASIPAIIGLVPLSLQIILFGKNAFRDYTLVAKQFDFWIICTLGVIQILLVIYSFILFIKGVSVVQKFSAIKAIKSIILVPFMLTFITGIILIINHYL